MALYAFDGTWNEDETEPIADTNVVKFRDAYRGKPEYVEGVGTRFGALGRALGGFLGVGGRTRIEEMYEKLVANWQNGDRDIDIIGFSRGAALAVHFSNVITKVGVRSGDNVLANPRIRFLGVWDVVGAFGLPINFVLNFQEINIGYDLTVSDNVDQCVHAMALNERRQAFNVTRLNVGNGKNNIEERWFRGVHSDVGGGNKNIALSNISLRWMMEKAKACGLPLQESDINALDAASDPRAPLGHNLDPIENPKRIVHPTDRFHPTAIGKEIGVGESEEFIVRAPEQYSWSGVRLKAGGHYSFIVREGQKWRDKDIECGPDGWRSEDLPWYKESLVGLFESRRRCPKANWFELIGAVGDDGDNFFRIGKGGESATYQVPVDGELFAFANDLRTMYGNNHGELKVIVKQVNGPGTSQLKGCEEG